MVRGGTIISEIHWSTPTSIVKKGFHFKTPSTLLVSDKPHRTLKYFLALASDFPCVHFNWIKDSVEKDTLMPYEDYLLPTGVFLETGKVVRR